MNYIINPETGRQVRLDGKTGQRVLRQYGGGCNDVDSGYCELQKDDDETPIINKSGHYSCRFNSLPGDSKSKKYKRETGRKQSEKYCECVSSRCKGKDEDEVKYVEEEALPATLSQKKKQSRKKGEQKQADEERQRQAEEKRQRQAEHEKRQRQAEEKRQRQAEHEKRQRQVEHEKRQRQAEEERERKHASAASGRKKVGKVVQSLGATSYLDKSAKKTRQERKKIVEDDFESVCNPDSFAFHEYKEECETEGKRRQLRDSLVRDHYDTVCDDKNPTYQKHQDACDRETKRRQDAASGRKKVSKAVTAMGALSHLDKTAKASKAERQQSVSDDYDFICDSKRPFYQNYKVECEEEEKARQRQREKQQLVNDNADKYCDQTTSEYDFYRDECDVYQKEQAKQDAAKRGRQATQKLAKGIGQQVRITKGLKIDADHARQLREEEQQHRQEVADDPALYCDTDSDFYGIYEPYCGEYHTEVERDRRHASAQRGRDALARVSKASVTSSAFSKEGERHHQKLQAEADRKEKAAKALSATQRVGRELGKQGRVVGNIKQQVHETELQRQQEQARVNELKRLVHEQPELYCDTSSGSFFQYEPYCGEYLKEVEQERLNASAERGRSATQKLAKKVGKQALITKGLKIDADHARRLREEDQQHRQEVADDPELYCDTESDFYSIYEPYCGEYHKEVEADRRQASAQRGRDAVARASKASVTSSAFSKEGERHHQKRQAEAERKEKAAKALSATQRVSRELGKQGRAVGNIKQQVHETELQRQQEQERVDNLKRQVYEQPERYCDTSSGSFFQYEPYCGEYLKKVDEDRRHAAAKSGRDKLAKVSKASAASLSFGEEGKAHAQKREEQETARRQAAAKSGRDKLAKVSKASAASFSFGEEGKAHAQKREEQRAKEIEEDRDLAQQNPTTFCDVDYEDFDHFEPYCGDYLQQQTDGDPEKYCEDEKYKQKYEKYCRKYHQYKQQAQEQATQASDDEETRKAVKKSYKLLKDINKLKLKKLEERAKNSNWNLNSVEQQKVEKEAGARDHLKQLGREDVIQELDQAYQQAVQAHHDKKRAEELESVF